MEDYWVILLMGGIVLAAVLRVRYLQKKRDETWRRFAELRGLNFEKGSFVSGPVLSGDQDLHNVRIEIVSTGRGKNKAYYTQYKAAILGRLPAGMVLKREHFFSGLEKLLGSQDVRTGYEELDQIAMIRAEQPDSVISYFLDESIRAAAVRHLRASPHAWIGDGAVYLRVRSTTEGREGLQKNLDQVLTTARALSR